MPLHIHSQLRDNMNTHIRILPNASQNDRFQVGVYECAVEFLQEILNNIDFSNNIVDFPVRALCQRCGNVVLHNVSHNYMLTIGILPNASPVSVVDLYTNRLKDRNYRQDHLPCHCDCAPLV